VGVDERTGSRLADPLVGTDFGEGSMSAAGIACAILMRIRQSHW
jgi:hypothetical protein